MTQKGVVAAGHPETAAAAGEILADGGNAFDAVLGAVFAACVAEPVLSSLGGGGFLMARPAGSDPVLYDFFTETPRRGAAGDGADFHPIDADFGTVTQEFHIGMASMATPGTVAGLFRAHRDLGTLPMTRIVEPAVRLARGGFTINALQAYLFQVVGAIYMSSPESRAIFASRTDPTRLKGEGETMANLEFARTLDALAREGEDLFYKGDIAAAIANDCAERGGLLTRDDFEAYRVEQRKPLALNYRGTRLFTNPPPSTGGILIAFGLKLLAGLDVEKLGFGRAAYLGHLARVMDLTAKARVESGLNDGDVAGAAGRLLDAEFLARYAAEIPGRPATARGTTHINVIDAEGNAAALTISNGEGAGYIAPGTGIMVNNMLGEEDINPGGFHAWTPAMRMSSMMAPTLMEGAGGTITALGSGGSNRIRTAVLQVVLGLTDFALSPADAVDAPRIHFEDGLLSIEDGFDADEMAALLAAFERTKVWNQRNLFFGGVHVARAAPEGKGGARFTGAGDPRRGGVVTVV